MDGAWVHNISPFLWEFGNGIGIRWYGLAYLTGFMAAYLVVDLLAKRGKAMVTREQAADFITYAAIGTLIGGRVGYVLFYSPDLLTTWHSTFPYWGLLEVHKGGMASHGGIAGIAIAATLFAKKHKLPPAHLVDLTCFGGTLGVFFGRIANFINGELYGRECRPDLWMAVKFPSEIYGWGESEIAKLKDLGPAVQAVGEVVSRSGEKISANVELWNTWVTNISSSMSLQNIDFFKEAIVKATEAHNQGVIQALAPILTPRYPSQLIQSLLEGLFVFLIIAWFWRKPRPPGFTSCLFGVCYAIARIIGEQFRLPDREIGFQALGLTRGQWLSIAMLIMIITYYFIFVRPRKERVGGW